MLIGSRNSYFLYKQGFMLEEEWEYRKRVEDRRREVKFTVIN